MSTLKYKNIIVENVLMVKVEDCVNASGNSDIVVSYAGNGFRNSFKLDNTNTLNIRAKGSINEVTSVSDVRVFGDVQHVTSGGRVTVQGSIKRFDNQQRNIIIDKSVQVTSKGMKSNKLEITGSLYFLDVSVSFFIKNKIDVEIHGNCGCIMATNNCEIKGNVDSVCAITGVKYTN